MTDKKVSGISSEERRDIIDRPMPVPSHSFILSQMPGGTIFTFDWRTKIPFLGFTKYRVLYVFYKVYYI